MVCGRLHTKPRESPAEPCRASHLVAVLKQGSQPTSHRYRDRRAAGRGVWTQLGSQQQRTEACEYTLFNQGAEEEGQAGRPGNNWFCLCAPDVWVVQEGAYPAFLLP